MQAAYPRPGGRCTFGEWLCELLACCHVCCSPDAVVEREGLRLRVLMYVTRRCTGPLRVLCTSSAISCCRRACTETHWCVSQRGIWGL